MTIEELEQWFANAPKPELPIYLNEATKITNYETFVNSHLIGIKNAMNDRVKQPLLDRLLNLKLIMEANL